MQVSFSVAALGMVLLSPGTQQSGAFSAGAVGSSHQTSPVRSLQELKSGVEELREAMALEGIQIANPPTLVKVTIETDDSKRAANLQAGEIKPRLDIRSGIMTQETIQTFESIFTAVQMAAAEENGERVASLVAVNLESKRTQRVSKPKDDAHRFMSTFSAGI